MSRKIDPLRGERLRTGYYDAKGNRRFLLTQKDADYILYEQHEEGDGATLTKLGKAKSPDILEEKYNVYDKVRGDA